MTPAVTMVRAVARQEAARPADTVTVAPAWTEHGWALGPGAVAAIGGAIVLVSTLVG